MYVLSIFLLVFMRGVSRGITGLLSRITGTYTKIFKTEHELQPVSVTPRFAIQVLPQRLSWRYCSPPTTDIAHYCEDRPPRKPRNLKRYGQYADDLEPLFD